METRDVLCIGNWSCTGNITGLVSIKGQKLIKKTTLNIVVRPMIDSLRTSADGFFLWRPPLVNILSLANDGTWYQHEKNTICWEYLLMIWWTVESVFFNRFTLNTPGSGCWDVCMNAKQEPGPLKSSSSRQTFD